MTLHPFRDPFYVVAGAAFGAVIFTLGVLVLRRFSSASTRKGLAAVGAIVLFAARAAHDLRVWQQFDTFGAEYNLIDGRVDLRRQLPVGDAFVDLSSPADVERSLFEKEVSEFLMRSRTSWNTPDKL